MKFITKLLIKDRLRELYDLKREAKSELTKSQQEILSLIGELDKEVK